MHSKIGASGAKRWMTCPASIVLAEQNPEQVHNPESEYAKEGTLAHELAEADLCIFLGGNPEPLDVTEEMQTFVNAYTNEVIDCILNIDDPKVLIEAKVDMSYVHPDLFGTADAVVYDPEEQHLHVFDLKYGEGIMVDPYENPQLLFYASCLLMRFMPKTVTSYIVQPRANSGDTVKFWTYPVSRLYEFQEEVKEAIARMEELAQDELITSDEVCSGDHCQFCPVLSICPKHLETFTALDEMKDAEITSPMTDEQVYHILSQRKALNKWLDELEKIQERKLLEGGTSELFKLVEKRTQRTWTNETTVTRKFGKKKLTVTKIMSPAQAEKVEGINKKDLEPYITKPQGQPTLALIDDKRPSINAPALETFGELE